MQESIAALSPIFIASDSDGCELAMGRWSRKDTTGSPHLRVIWKQLFDVLGAIDRAALADDIL